MLQLLPFMLIVDCEEELHIVSEDFSYWLDYFWQVINENKE